MDSMYTMYQLDMGTFPERQQWLRKPCVPCMPVALLKFDYLQMCLVICTSKVVHQMGLAFLE